MSSFSYSSQNVRNGTQCFYCSYVRGVQISMEYKGRGFFSGKNGVYILDLGAEPPRTDLYLVTIWARLIRVARKLD